MSVRPKATNSRSSNLLVVSCITLCAAVILPELRAATNTPTMDRSAAFDMDGAQVIQDEAHIGIINGKITGAISYRDVAGMTGLWSPPFVASNFMFDARVAGKKVPTSKWTWRPFQVVRAGSAGEVSVSTKTTTIYGRRAVVVSLTYNNSGDTPVPLDFFTLSWLDSVQDWDFATPYCRKEATPIADGRTLTIRQGDVALVLAIDSEDWAWEVSGNLGHAAAVLPAHSSRTVNVIISLDTAEAAANCVKEILADPAAAIVAAEREYRRQVANLFDKLPTFSSDNPQLDRWYNRSLVHLLTNRWDLPNFLLQPYYATGGMNGGCVANYLYNFGEPWEIFPLYDPAASKTHIKHFLKIDLLKHFNFMPITGAASGPWYMVNQEKIIGLTYYYVLLTGDTAFLDEEVDGKTIRDHMVIHALFGDDIDKPIDLIDYGASGSHLELRRAYTYNHISPDLNARRYANYLRAADLCDLAGKPAPVLRDRAAQLKPLVKERLWDPKSRWFFFEDPSGNRDFRYTVQMFKPIGSGALDEECEAGLLSHLNENEFLSAYGLHSISKRDPAFDQLDYDNGGGGTCVCFPPQIIERLYQADQPKLAGEIMQRLLWWGDVMPYWGDSVASNCVDYRRDTPLQCTLDGSTAAQCIIFGTFGVQAVPNGDIVFRPHELPFASKMSLTGLRVRGHSFDVRVDGKQYEVTSGDQSITSPMGESVVFVAANGKFRAAK